MAEAATKYRLTVDQFMRMGELGIFPDESRVELIDGEIVEMSPTGPPHGSSVARLIEAFMPLVGRAVLWTRSTIVLGPIHAPQPDFALCRFREDRYATANPTPADILLVVEVAETSLDRDRTGKAALYASHGIPEYWIVNLDDRCVEVHRQPEGDGYRERRIVARDGRVAPIAFSDHQVPAGDLLP